MFDRPLNRSNVHSLNGGAADCNDTVYSDQPSSSSRDIVLRFCNLDTGRTYVIWTKNDFTIGNFFCW